MIARLVVFVDEAVRLVAVLWIAASVFYLVDALLAVRISEIIAMSVNAGIGALALGLLNGRLRS